MKFCSAGVIQARTTTVRLLLIVTTRPSMRPTKISLVPFSAGNDCAGIKDVIVIEAGA